MALTSIQKQKLEKLVRSQIDETRNLLNKKQSNEIDDIREEARKHPPKRIEQLLDRYNQIVKEQEKIEKEIEKSDFVLRKNYSDKTGTIEMDYGSKILDKVEEKYKKAIKQLEQVERQSYFDIYSENADMKKVYEKIADKLKDITKGLN